MAKSENNPQLYKDEFSRIFNEYRAKIEEITRRTTENLQSINGITDVADEPDISAEVDTEKSEETLSQVELEPAKKPIEVIWPSEKESVEIIREAKRKAQQLINQAEVSIKKEARKKTQTQVDKIIGKAKKEAEVIIARVMQAAERERDNAIAASKDEAMQFIREITEKCRQETRAESSRVIAEANEKAEKMMAELVTSSKEINFLVTEIVDRAKNTIIEFEDRLQTETGELARAITEAQNKLEQATMIYREEKQMPELSTKNRETYDNPTLEVRLISEKGNGKKGNPALYSGQVEMRSLQSFDYQYMKKMKKYLVHIPGIKYLQENASEKEMSVLFDVKEPLPLLDILSNMPLVDKVVTEDDDICVIFKNSP